MYILFRRDSIESVDFDCTAEEKILFDMFGEDYNEVIFFKNEALLQSVSYIRFSLS